MEGNFINAKIFIPGQDGKERRGVKVALTLDKISEWIRLQGLDEYTTAGLIELAKKTPTSALPHFRRNFNLMIARVRQKRQQEQRGNIDGENS